MNTHSKRREELLQRCRRERNELIVSGTATVARLPRPRDLARWMRFARRLLRGIRAGESHAWD